MRAGGSWVVTALRYVRGQRCFMKWVVPVEASGDPWGLMEYITCAQCNHQQWSEGMSACALRPRQVTSIVMHRDGCGGAD